MTLKQSELKRKIIGLSEIYGHRELELDEFIAGKTYIPPSGKIISGAEIANGVEAVLDGWLTEGRWTDKFEKKLARYIGVRCASLCNSGSSANLLAISALTSPKLGKKALKPGDEVIVAAAAFPTTLNPVIQNGLVPVFVDVDLGTYMPNAQTIMNAIVPGKTKAIFIAHTLGNPATILRHAEQLKKDGVYLIEDNCDALGSVFEEKKTGGFGDIATQSFYPAHHITTGEGGAVLTRRTKLRKIIESFRDWGRDCWCKPGHEDTCQKRFNCGIKGLPKDYDHKYVYSHIGYNLKGTDLQAAIGLAQMDRLDYFTLRRRENYDELFAMLMPWEDWLLLPHPTQGSEPSWFGFPIAVKAEAPFTRYELVEHLNEKRIGTRYLFGGNLLLQPAYQNPSFEYRIYGELDKSETIANSVFWIGIWPGIDEKRINYMSEIFRDFMRSF